LCVPRREAREQRRAESVAFRDEIYLRILVYLVIYDFG